MKQQMVSARWRAAAAGLALGLALASCATEEVPVAIGGNRAGGTVDMSYEYGAFERPQVDWNIAQQSALQRCKAWGYTNAEAFGGAINQCVAANAYGCLRERVTMTYQCTTDAQQSLGQQPVGANRPAGATAGGPEQPRSRNCGVRSPTDPTAVTCN
jgi:hypothetical protein